MNYTILFSVVFLITFVSGRRHIMHLNMLFRHGDRSSITPYPFEGYKPYDIWPLGFGQLTQEGIEQHYLLGKWLRIRYHDFQPNDYNVSSLFMRSSDIDRALMSAQSLLAGFFHKSNSSLSKYGLHWRPIPVHTVSRDTDTLFGFAPCRRRDERRDEIARSEKVANFLKNHSKIVKLLSTEYSIANLTPDHISQISDDLLCLSVHNATLPKWYTPDIAGELDLISDFLFEVIFVDEVFQKFQVGVYLKELFNKMAKFIHGNSTRGVERLVMHSGHDTNVGTVLAAMGVYAGEKKPQYTALVIIELLGPSNPSTATQDYSLRLLYKRGWRDPEGEYLQFAACKDQPGAEGCPFDTVFKAVEPLMLDPAKYNEACSTAGHLLTVVNGDPNNTTWIWPTVLWSFLMILTGSLITVFCAVLRIRSRKYSPLISATDSPCSSTA